jgi:hypothetical protein
MSRPCWLCSQPNSLADAQCGHEYECVRCGVRLEHVVPLVRPLSGPHWVWLRPDTITPAAAIHAAEAWQEATMHPEEACPTSTPTSA